jgi:hypothetical protein
MRWLRFVRFGSLLQRLGLVALGAGLVASCGGVDSGGTGAPAVAFASGPISGFGSVIVNGVHFDDRSAVVSDADGNLHSADDLRLGMTADVNGTAFGTDADGDEVSTATRIVFGSAVLGPLSASDTVARTLTVFGQTIDISDSTVFDAGLVGGQAALRPGDVVAIYAALDVATGHYAASRVERSAAVAGYRLRGVVSGLDTSAKAFSIGSTRISYAGTAAVGAPADLADGDVVRVALAPLANNGVWSATAIDEALAPIASGEEARIKGLVSAFTSSTTFSVDGTPVDARSAQFPDGSSGVVLGARVEVRGMAASGVLVATRVDLDQSGNGGDGGGEFEIRDVISTVNAPAQTFVVHGVTVSYSGSVDFRNGSAADLAVGRNVEARGALSADGTQLQATRVTFRD